MHTTNGSLAVLFCEEEGVGNGARMKLAKDERMEREKRIPEAAVVVVVMVTSDDDDG
jgi:hypothetical protein